MVKKMIIVEGPAGSGKSTIARYLAAHFNYPSIHSSLPGRRPSAADAPAQSSINDYTKMVLALHALTQGSKAVFMDRYAVSELVYGHLRLDPSSDTFSVGAHLDNLTSLIRERVIDEWNYMSVHAAGSLERRRMHSPHIYRVLWLIYTPSIDTIAVRRFQAQRTFSWTPVQEARLYTYVVRALLNMKSQTHHVLWETAPNLLTDQNFLDSIGRWIDEDIN